MMNRHTDSRTSGGHSGQYAKPVEMFSFVLQAGTDDELVCVGYRHSLPKRIVSFIFSVLTVGALQLVFYWKPNWHLICTCSKCPLGLAEYILLKNQYSETFVANVQSKNVAENPFESPVYSGVLYRPSSEPGVVMTTGAINSLPVTAHGDTTVATIGLDIATGDDDEEEDAEDTTALLKNANKETQTSVRYFIHQKLQYLWNDDSDTFEPLGGLEKCTPCPAFYEKYQGYSKDQQQRRSTVYGQNTINIEVKSYGKLFVEEILNPFYIFQIFSVILWFAEVYYYYAACIVVIMVFSLGVSLYETRKQAITLRDMVSHKSTVTVLRDNGESEEINCELLVPGDVILIPSNGCFMSCDALLTSGNCIVNESMLTGESVPITKTPLPYHPPTESEGLAYYSPENHKRHTLFCGTHVIQTRYYGNEHVKAVVVRTGFSTMKGELVRSILFPKPIGFKFYQDALKFIGILSVLAVIGIIYTVLILHLKHNGAVSDIVFKALDIVTVAVPPSLPAAMTIGTVYAQNRLKKQGVFCISPQRINICGKLKLICFDKTGTLTEDGLDLWGVVPLQDQHFLPAVQNVQQLPRGPFLAAMATCHSLTKIDGELMGDPLDLKMFEATNWLLEEPGKETTRFDSIIPTIVKPTTSDTYLAGNIENPYEVGIIRQFPFSSSLQRMSVITRTLGAKNMDVYVKGSPEMVVALSRKETVPLDFQEVLENYTQQGFRVIALAWRPMEPKFSWRQAQHIARTDIECNLTFLGLLIMQNALKPETTPIIKQLIDADIRTVMVTGDNMLTAVSVARDCGMVSARSKVIMVNATAPGGGAVPQIEWSYDTAPEKGMEQSTGDVRVHESYQDNSSSSDEGQYHFAVSGKSFAVLRTHFPNLIPKIVQKGTVYARMSPDQKTQLVESLQELGYCVGMCGDGANDCGALKTAHAGISLSEAEASVASPFTSKTPNISCVPTVIREGRAALVSSFGVFKYMALYSVIQFVTVIILYWIDSNLGDFQFLYIDLVITTTAAVLMGRNAAYPKLVRRRPPGSLVSPTILFSILVEVVIVTAVQLVAYFSLFTQSWFEPLVPNHDAEKNIKCHENTVVFFVSSFQYLIVAGAFAKGKPYRQPIWTNVLFLISLIGLASLTALMMFLPVPWKFLDDFLQTLQLATDHMEYTLIIGAIIAANFLISFGLEIFVVDSQLFQSCIKPLRCKKQPKNLYKRIENEIQADPHWPPVGTVTTLQNGITLVGSINTRDENSSC